MWLLMLLLPVFTDQGDITCFCSLTAQVTVTQADPTKVAKKSFLCNMEPLIEEIKCVFSVRIESQHLTPSRIIYAFQLFSLILGMVVWKPYMVEKPLISTRRTAVSIGSCIFFISHRLLAVIFLFLSKHLHTKDQDF